MSGPSYLEYKAPGQIFALALSSSDGASTSANPPKSPYSPSTSRQSPIAPFPKDLKLCIGSYYESAASNSLTVMGLNPNLLQDPDTFAQNHWGDDDESSRSTGNDFVPIAHHTTPYPATKVAFSPPSLAGRLSDSTHADESREMIASTSECLRLWDLSGPIASSSSYVGQQPQMTHSLSERSALTNKTFRDTPAPLTSFDWSTIDPSRVVTSSIDTTCTIWDISVNKAETQLIAHDKEVFDVAWAPNSHQVFASAGADGSVRSFDRRALETSTILYDHESANTQSASANARRVRGAPLLRIAFNPTDPNSLAVIHADNPIISILDVRSPGLPIAELQSHQGAVNGIAWCGSASSLNANNHSNGEYTESGNSVLASVSDDCQILLWDLLRPNTQQDSKSKPQTLPRPVTLPNAAYSAPAQIDSVAWGGGREYLAVDMGSTVRCLRL